MPLKYYRFSNLYTLSCFTHESQIFSPKFEFSTFKYSQFMISVTSLSTSETNKVIEKLTKLESIIKHHVNQRLHGSFWWGN